MAIASLRITWITLMGSLYYNWMSIWQKRNKKEFFLYANHYCPE